MKFTIRQARTHAGFTQAAISKELGIDRGAYIRLEKDPTRATIRQINEISRITGIPVGDIFLGCTSTFVEDSQPDTEQRG